MSCAGVVIGENMMSLPLKPQALAHEQLSIAGAVNAAAPPPAESSAGRGWVA